MSKYQPPGFRLNWSQPYWYHPVSLKSLENDINVLGYQEKRYGSRKGPSVELVRRGSFAKSVDQATFVPNGTNHHYLIQTQARELAAYLANLPENERPTAIFTSPYCK